MTIRLLCDARGKHRKAFMDRLVEMSNGEVEIALHFGDRDADFHAPCLQRMEVRDGKMGHLMKDHVVKGANFELLGSDEFRRMMETAVDQFHRTGPAYQYRSHDLNNLQDYLDYYHILTDAVAQQIADSGATHALFYNVPHLGYDTVLYQVAKAMGLKTIVLCQTIFPSLYFSVEKIEDLGDFEAAGSDAPPMEIEKGSKPHLFYMDDRWQKESTRGKLNRKAVGNFITYMLRKDPAKLLNPAYIVRTLKRMKAIYGALPDWRDPFAKFFHESELAYFEHLAQYENQDIDLSGKFIYVPLHNQPEMSTSALGGPWRDQVLMIEALARHLPDGWEILVKENPRQGAYARGPLFWHRLNRIKGVKFVPSDLSTHELSDRAQFVATVTGTAAWEAVRKGRPAVIFGNAWYKRLPGIHRFEEGMDFEAVAASTFDHDQLCKEAGALLARCHHGVIEQVYLENTESYDAEENLEEVARTTLGLLKGDVPLTFHK
ncbi:hypothetical protein HCZ30_08730 [Marivivens donghaensis]|uniref:Capsule polysaccharide biosynthesis protein n=1 Tax=Marivivens donghaensis TaxID=1699413 RepID=A0ABX0VYL4_9RHOB|nr:hypothetical protein [Marivivens donghaensis]NIY72520.1 hypothetical protein [Marivivens donghaensis]